MIPDFKTFIGESIWSDMQDRGTGDIEKKEDNTDPDFNWDATISIDLIAKIYSGGDYMEDLESSDRKEVRLLFKEIKDKLKASKVELKKNKLTVKLEPGMITISGVSERNLMYFTKKLVEEWLNDVNTLYVDDIESILSFEDIEDDLEYDYKSLWDDFQEYLYNTIEH